MIGVSKCSCIWSLVLAELAGWSLAFSVGPRFIAVPFRSTTKYQTKRSHSEFSLLEEEGEETDLPKDVRGSDYVIVQQEKNPDHQPIDMSTVANDDDAIYQQQKPEYGAMSPGTVVQVQIGDLALARKAWKKRRRTGSPLLVPCSVINVDHRSLVRWNLIFLLEKFGKARPDGIEISERELSKTYRTYLKSSLQKQTSALGYESSHDMIVGLFTKKVQEAYGIRLIVKTDGQLVLKAPMSRTRAQKRAARTPLLQFRDPKPSDVHGDTGTLIHTGYLRTRTLEQDPTDRSYAFLPLSAALRVSQKDDVDTGRVEEGSIHSAVVFDFDLAGDAGSPLLTLSLNPRGVREILKVKPDRKYEIVENPKHALQNLKVGDGPFRAKVVHLQYRGALVDMGVGRRFSSDGMVKVLGNLPFQESVEVVEKNGKTQQNMLGFEDEGDFDYGYDEDLDDDVESALFNFDNEDEEDIDEEDDVADKLLSLRSGESFKDDTFEDDEEEEDISHLFELNDDGRLAYTDPETGKTVVMSSLEEDYYEDEDGEDDEDENDITSSAMNVDMIDDEDLDFDMNALFQEGEDGTVAFVDPESGETLEVGSSDEEYEDMMTIKSLIDQYSRPPFPKNVDYTYTKEKKSSPNAKEKKTTKDATPAPKVVSKRLRVGEEVDVYIRSVSKQSGQFTVSMNPTVQGRKAKDLKKESNAMKKLDRLKTSLGGSLQRIWELEGQECDGTVKATSQSGEWIYIQPEMADLPVGVATISTQDLDHQALVAGDSVRVRIAGVDEQRGQLAMDLLGKLGP